jgi:hypothetical protein
MERITHRKYESNFNIRYSDASVMVDVLNKIKEGIRTVPKLDVLSMPYRVHFVRVGPYGLEIEITCYFATKSIDEFLALQQVRYGIDCIVCMVITNSIQKAQFQYDIIIIIRAFTRTTKLKTII